MRDEQQRFSDVGRLETAEAELSFLHRLATSAAQVHGHELGEWEPGKWLSRAQCVRCGAEARVSCSLIECTIGGAALDCLCGEEQVAKVA